MIRRTWTAEEFADNRYELPDGGRWTELVAGNTVALDPPSDHHGSTVLNISKALAEYQDHKREGYACFELGLIVEREPDTVLRPAISYFVTGRRWVELDKQITETRPALVVEMASSPDRRRYIRQRLDRYRAWGIAVVWEVDPDARTVVVHQGEFADAKTDNSAITGAASWHSQLFPAPILQGFHVSLADVFREREW